MDESQDQSIYQASWGEIFFKNFLAGMAKSFGSIFIFLLLLSAIYYALGPMITTKVNKAQEFINNLQQNPIFNQYVPR